jgi:Cu2+-exporting ATPase
MLTGESQPAEKELNSTVLASTLVLSGKIYILVKKAGNETSIAQIGDILNQTIHSKTKSELWIEQLVNKASAPTLAFSAACIPVIGFTPSFSILTSYIGPRSVVLSSVAMMNYMKLFADHGILIKDGGAMEKLNSVDCIIFDKTGTLTAAQPTVKKIIKLSAFSEMDILAYTAAAEGKQAHPIALAILDEAKNRQIPLPICDKTEYTVGYGVEASINNKRVLVGSARLMKQKEIELPQNLTKILQESDQKGYSTIMVAIDKHLVGIIELCPTVHLEVKNIIKKLRKHHVKETYILSGDDENPTRSLATELGIDHYYAEVLPQEKAAIIKQLQEDGKTVCFVGDGINDTIALKQADVSISLSGATSAAKDIAEIILMDGTISQLEKLFELSKDFKKTFSKVITSGIVPSVLSIASTFVLGTGLWTAFFINQLTFIAIPIVMAPLKTHKK